MIQSEGYRPRIAMLASGSGSTVEAVVRAAAEERINLQVGAVICNRTPEKAGVYDRVERLNNRYGLDIQTAEIGPHTHPKGRVDRGQTDEESEAVVSFVEKYAYVHVALAGYMRIVRGQLLEDYGWHEGMDDLEAGMTNTHPGILPQTADTYGPGASQRVLDMGLAETMHTFHAVASGVDAGPVIAEHPVPVLEGDTADTLFERVQVVEKAAYPYALDKFLGMQAVKFGQE